MEEQPERSIEEKRVIMSDDRFPLSVPKNTSQDPNILAKGDQFDMAEKVYDRCYINWPNKMTTSAPGPVTTGYDFVHHKQFSGINFATQDYMSLCYHPSSVAAGVEALKRYGTHSGGSPLFFGKHPYYLEVLQSLKRAFSKIYSNPSPGIFSAGWMAGFGVVSSLVGKRDHIIMDELCHNCLVHGAKASMATVHKIEHLNNDAMVAKMEELRKQYPKAGIMVISEGLFSMDSDCADLNRIQQAAKANEAVLVVDCAHDMFGHGSIGLGNAGDKIKDFDNVILLGSGSKSLSNNFGWAVSNKQSYPNFLNFYAGSFTFSNALAPSVAAIVSHNIDLLMSEEGTRRRARVLENSIYVRKRLVDEGFEVIGEPSPVVIILIGSETISRSIANMMYAKGIVVNSVEFPACEPGDSRMRMQLQCDHTKEQLDYFVDTLKEIMPEVEEYLANDDLIKAVASIAEKRALKEAAASERL